MSTANPKRFTTASLGRLTGYSEARVRQLADAGELPHTRATDGTRLFGADALAQLLQRERRRK